MAERWRSSFTIDNWNAIVRGQDSARGQVAEIAAGQWGRVRWDQLISIGVDRARISRWVDDGYLHPVYPRVYAVGHSAAGIEADLVAAVFYAGPGAMLSHATAAWWWELTDREPARIEVSTPRRCASLPSTRSHRGVIVHQRRRVERMWHRRLPVTTVSQSLLDFGSVASLRRVRHVLAQAEYRRKLDFESVNEIVGRGRPGSEKLRRAVESHRPELAYTRSELERRFLELCEAASLPRPEVNVIVHGIMVDALWREQRVVVELDGVGAHGTPAQIGRDHERDLRLRAAGFTVLRYTWRQITRRPRAILADLRRALRLR